MSATVGARLTAEQALVRLREGNERFVAHREQHPDRGADVRLQLVAAQHPFAVIVGCSDSRVPPELLFDVGLGDLFVIRNAGSIVDHLVVASAEYAVEHLGVSLVLVLGHEGCGVITAAVGVERDGLAVQGHIWDLIDAVRPAVDMVGRDSKDVIDEALQAHVAIQAERLRRAEPILARSARSGVIKVIGARYDIDRCQVELLT
jgi:carbonic anhydrase